MERGGKPFLRGNGREWKDKEEGGGRFGSRGDGAQRGDGMGSYQRVRCHIKKKKKNVEREGGADDGICRAAKPER